MNIYFDKDKKVIIIEEGWVKEIPPEQFLNAVDECLLMKLKKVEFLKFGTLNKLMERLEKLADESASATKNIEIRRIVVEKNCLAQMRYLIKYKEIEQRRIKEEMLERQMGE